MSNDKTKWIFDDKDSFDNDGTEATVGEFTETFSSDQTAAGTNWNDSEATRLVDGGASDKTTLSRSGAFAGEKTGFENIDPVVGWLVVVKGPGLGQAVQIGAGMNTLGRGTAARVSLGFGDSSISSDDHARIIYDDDSRAFFIAHGSGKNITKVNGQMVANTLPLENGALVEVTKSTHLRFVAFCSESFDWADVEDSGSA